MTLSFYTVFISGQLRFKKSADQIVEASGRWIRYIDKNSKYEIEHFAGLFVKIRWIGESIDIRNIDLMMKNISRNVETLFVASRVTVVIKHEESGV